MSSKRQQQAFNQRVEQLLVELGGTPKEGAFRPTYVLGTIYGPLEVTPADDFIAARFEEVDKAAKGFGVTGIFQHRLNPYSGKFNFGQGMLFGLRDQDRPEAEDYVQGEFRREVAPLLIKKE
jgi:hypothetical protein